MVTAHKVADGSLVARNERGSATMSVLKPGVLLYVCGGYFAGEFYEPMVAPAREMIERHQSLVLLVDGWDLVGVDTAYREAWTAWFKLHRERFRMTLLVRTKLVEMAASLANLFTGTRVITTYSNVDAWERACNVDIAGFRRSIPARPHP